MKGKGIVMHENKKEVALAISSLCAVAAVVGAVVGGCNHVIHSEEKRLDEMHQNRINQLKKISEEYKDGVTLIDKWKTHDEYGFALDTDGRTNTTEIIMKGIRRQDEIDQRLWNESQIGETKSFEAWARRLYGAKAIIMADRMAERF